MVKLGTLFFIFLAFLGMPVCSSSAQTITVAVVAPDDSKMERDIIAGLEKAFFDMDIRGDVIAFHETCDTGSDLKTAARIVRRKASFVIGYSCENSAFEAQKIYDTADIPLFLLSLSTPKLTSERHDNTIRLTSRTDKHYDTFAQLVNQDFPTSRFLILNDTSKEASSFINVLKKELPKKSYKALDLPEKQINQNIKKIQQSSDFKPNIIILGAITEDSAVRMISRVREAGIKLPILGLDVLGSPQFGKMIGDMKEGIYFYAAEKKNYSLDAATLITEMRLETGEVNDLMIGSYVAAQIFHEELLRNESPSSPVILREKSFKTVLGPIDFDVDGDIKNRFPRQLYKWLENEIILTSQPIDK